MEQKESNKIRMFSVVLGVLTQFEAIWITNLGLKELVDLLKNYLDAIAGKRPMADAKTDGITTDKRALKSDLVFSILEVGKPLAALFFGAKNMELCAKVTFSKTGLEAMGEDDLADKGIEVAKLATDNLEKGKKNGLTQDKITHLEEISALFKSTAPKGREVVSMRKASKKSRRQLISETAVMLEQQMDGIVELYHRASPEFWNAYFNGRLIVDYGIRHDTPKKKAAAAQKKAKAAAKKVKKTKGATETNGAAGTNEEALKTKATLKGTATPNSETGKTEDTVKD